MKLIFWGAARQVTGSMHLIELHDGYRILLDCGLDYEQKRNFHYAPQVSFPFEPTSIGCVILSHAHIDHSGNIPNLVRQGFRGQILCTPPTLQLSRQLLLDSAKIQSYEYKKGKKGKVKSPKPLYTTSNVNESMEQFVTLDFHKPFRLHEHVEMEFCGAGHLLGAAAVLLKIEDKGKLKTLYFTGDRGRNNSPLTPDAEPIQKCDALISESTYGNRNHRKGIDPAEELMQFVESCCVQKNGRLIIPAFSVGRTQAILFCLKKLHEQGKLPPIKVFVDSPLAIKGIDIYEKNIHLLNDEAREFLKSHGDLFHWENLQLVEDAEHSKELDSYFDPCIIVSAAGMVEGGRIQQHVANNISNPYSTILIAGYCAEGTLGHRLLQGMQTIRIKNRELPVYATVASTDAFSSHADGEQLTYDILQANAGKTFLVHGEGLNMETLQQKLEEGGLPEVWLPEAGDEFIL
ncbi:MAG: MBL fold metallo-hydrolase [Flavobacteriaceae bacterium]|nr:MBL fold metallo-hydrolase [Flavobacteriaceae bacterium]